MSYSRTSSPSSPIKRLSVRGRSSPGKASSHRWKDGGCQWSSNSLPRRPPKADDVLEWQFLICVKWSDLFCSAPRIWIQQQSAFEGKKQKQRTLLTFFVFLIRMFINSLTVHIILYRRYTKANVTFCYSARSTRKHTHKSYSAKLPRSNGPKR